MTLPRSLAVLLPLLLGIEAAEAPEPAWRVAERDRVVLAEPADGSAVRGRIRAGDSFAVLGSAEGPGCEAGWLILPGHGYLCGAGTEVTDRPPVAQPALVSYDPPEPAEYAHYVDTGEYDASEPVELVPGIYAKRYRRFGGPLYADVAAYEAGAAPIGRLVRRIGSKYHFVEVAKTARGDVLVRADGQVAPVDQVYLYPVSRLQGRDLVDEPLELGQWPAFAVDYRGAPVHEAPDFDSAVHTTLAYHTPLAVRSAPVGDGHWWAVPHALPMPHWC